MREAVRPWGLFGHKKPLFDCRAMQHRLAGEDPTENTTTIMNFPEGGCYGGFTHPKLWEKHPLSTVDPEYLNSTLIRFNVSMWQPYKMLMVETAIKD